MVLEIFFPRIDPDRDDLQAANVKVAGKLRSYDENCKTAEC